MEENFVERLIQYPVSDVNRRWLMKVDWGTGSKSGNHSVGRAIIAALEDGVKIAEGREAFVTQKIKNKVMSSIWENRRLGARTRAIVASNHAHYLITQQISLFIYFYENPLKNWETQESVV